jgi:hypothetical protein
LFDLALLERNDLVDMDVQSRIQGFLGLLEKMTLLEPDNTLSLDFYNQLAVIMRIKILNNSLIDKKAKKETVDRLWKFFLDRSPNPMAKKLIGVLKSWSEHNESLALAHALVTITPESSDLFSLLPFDRTMDNLKVLEDEMNVGEDAKDDTKDDAKLFAIAPKEIPPYAIDKHTGRGKRKGAGLEKFFDEGALVVNELFPDPFEAVAKEWYLQLEQDKTFKKVKGAVIEQFILDNWCNGAQLEPKKNPFDSSSVTKKQKC